MSKIAIITPVYKAWDMVKKMCEHIDQNTHNKFVQILVADSCDWPDDFEEDIGGNRHFLKYDDGEPPEKHRPCITKATQGGYDFLKEHGIEFDYLFYVETDVMVPQDWDQKLINLSNFLPKDWVSLDVYPVDEEDRVTYPAANHSISRGLVEHHQHLFEVLQYGDWNAILLNPVVVAELNKSWRFDDVPSHHDILLSRNFREKRGYERENWEPPLFYRTQEVRAVHYPNSSRSELPEGLKTPSNPG